MREGPVAPALHSLPLHLPHKAWQPLPGPVPSPPAAHGDTNPCASSAPRTPPPAWSQGSCRSGPAQMPPSPAQTRPVLTACSVDTACPPHPQNPPGQPGFSSLPVGSSGPRTLLGTRKPLIKHLLIAGVSPSCCHMLASEPVSSAGHRGDPGDTGKEGWWEGALNLRDQPSECGLCITSSRQPSQPELLPPSSSVPAQASSSWEVFPARCRESGEPGWESQPGSLRSCGWGSLLWSQAFLGLRGSGG